MASSSKSGINDKTKKMGKKVSGIVGLGGGNPAWQEFDGNIWSTAGKHFGGEFSMATAGANQPNEDANHVELGQCSTFVGVHDGHCGNMASFHVRVNLFRNLINRVGSDQGMSEEAIKGAFNDAENDFMRYVRLEYKRNCLVATTGACCLIGILWKNRLYVANLGNSRAVIGHTNTLNNIVSEQLTEEHDVNNTRAREQFLKAFPEVIDPSTLVSKDDNGYWRIKNKIKVWRAIGDAYLKSDEFCIPEQHSRFHVPGNIDRPLLSAEPAVYVRDIQPADRFVILASDGLWSQLPIQEAASIVQRHGQKKGIAKKLVKEAMIRAGKAVGMSYEELTRIPAGEPRRRVHDDITVVILFFEHKRLNGEQIRKVDDLSIKSGIYAPTLSSFNALRKNHPGEWPPAL